MTSLARPVSRSGLAGSVAGLALAAMLTGCTDGATRIAYDIEAGVSAFRNSSATRYSIKHVPEGEPDGCSGPYKVQLSAESALVIWCMDAAAARVVASHTTTYHLNFVGVPRQLNLEKAAAEPLSIDLEKRGGRIVVVGIR